MAAGIRPTTSANGARASAAASAASTMRGSPTGRVLPFHVSCAPAAATTLSAQLVFGPYGRLALLVLRRTPGAAALSG